MDGTPGPPARKKIGAPGAAEKDFNRIKDNLIIDFDPLLRFSFTHRLPDSASYSLPSYVLNLSGLMLNLPGKSTWAYNETQMHRLAITINKNDVQYSLDIHNN